MGREIWAGIPPDFVLSNQLCNPSPLRHPRPLTMRFQSAECPSWGGVLLTPREDVYFKLSMDDQLERLIRLQQLDIERTKLRESIAAIPLRLTPLEEQMARQQQSLEHAEKALQAEEKSRRNLEGDLKDQQQKIVKYREQSGGVKTNEQYHALQHEIGFAEAEIRRIEDSQLTSLVRSEGLDARRAQAAKDIADHKKQIDRERKKADAESSAIRRRLSELENECAKVREAIQESLLVQYDRLAGSSRKTALARASGQRCLACQMSMRPQFWNEVRGGSLLTCESCGRMLYFDPVESVPLAQPELPS